MQRGGAVHHDQADAAPAQPTHHVAPGGWRRILAGFLVGAAVGAAIALLLPRDDGPVRASSRG
jgi:hypothetical protein